MHSVIPLSLETRREALVALGLPLVDRVASRLARRLPSSVARDDLRGAGAEGLLRAIESFDPRVCERFETYAELRIRGAMLDELRGSDTLTRHARRRLATFARAARSLEREHGRAASEAEIAAEVGIELATYQRIVSEAGRAPGLLHAGETDPDAVPGAEADPAEACAARELRARLGRALTRLPERTQEVLRLYYAEDRTQAEIGRTLGVTESRVCQILSKAIATLRDALARDDADGDRA